jgi:hypothetical protein
MSKAKTARKSKKSVKVRKRYPFESTPPGESFVEDDLSQWPRLRVSASRFNKKHGRNFIVQKDGDVLRCGEPE